MNVINAQKEDWQTWTSEAVVECLHIAIFSYEQVQIEFYNDNDGESVFEPV